MLSFNESPSIEKQTAGLIPIVVQGAVQCRLCYPGGCSMQLLCWRLACLNICFCLQVFSLAEPNVLCYILVLH